MSISSEVNPALLRLSLTSWLRKRIVRFKPIVNDLQDYDRDELGQEKFVVFLMATFGEGDPTDNAQVREETQGQKCDRAPV